MAENTKTRIVHAGRDPQQYKGAVNTPVVRTSTILFESYEELRNADGGENIRRTYGRHGTDTRFDLENQLAKLQGTEAAFLLPSGLSAVTFALIATLSHGDHVLVADCVYGPTRLFCNTELKRMGIEVTYFDPMIGAGIEALFKPNTKVVYLESPGSITFEVQDVPTIAKIAHQKGAVVLADQTWATPIADYLPGLGIDVIIQSLTKYASGHSDVVMGAVLASGDVAKKLDNCHKHYGYAVSPDDCYLMARGLRTIGVRLEQQEKNALALAEWFSKRPETLKLLHPAYPSCPGHEFWKRDMKNSCGLFAVLLKPYTDEAVAAMLNGLHYFPMGFSWGGYESLMLHLNPSYARTATKWDAGAGTLLRVHAGVEAVEDLIADLEAGFQRLNNAA